MRKIADISKNHYETPEVYVEPLGFEGPACLAISQLPIEFLLMLEEDGFYQLDDTQYGNDEGFWD